MNRLAEDIFEEARRKTSSVVRAARRVLDLYRAFVREETLSRPWVFMAAGALLGLALPLYGMAFAGLSSRRDAVALGLLIPAALLGALGLLLGRRLDRALLLSVTDPLTGLFNRRRLCERLVDEMKLRGRYGGLGSIIAVDIDRMKDINDSFGHAAGDRAIRAVAGAIKECIRSTDVPARVGGDEFAVLLPRSSPSEASTVANRILEAVAARRTRLGLPVSVSIGIAGVHSTQAMADDDVLGLADEALYDAKASGRGRATVLAGD
jgi:diguanylate cyclase (GGDEF)-like protein